jgi:hypothetical protein
VAATVETVTDFKQVVEPLVEQHVEPPAAIEFLVTAASEFTV